MAHLTGQERARHVATMFARIAGRYDLLNTVMTAGRHHAWRRLAADMVVGGRPGPALDVATGTGDLALELARRPTVDHVVGLDFAPRMLSIAKSKARKSSLAGSVVYMLGDAHALPFPDNYFACATDGFGVRNLIDIPRALREMARVVQPGGRVAVLEIVRLDGAGPLSRVFPLYFRYVTPWLGVIMAGEREAYTYLPDSVQGFLSAGKLAAIMETAGLVNVRVRRLALGTVAILVGQKPG